MNRERYHRGSDLGPLKAAQHIVPFDVIANKKGVSYDMLKEECPYIGEIKSVNYFYQNTKEFVPGNYFKARTGREESTESTLIILFFHHLFRRLLPLFCIPFGVVLHQQHSSH